MKRQLSEKAQRFLTKKPTKIGTVQGYSYYECPIHGDETYMKVITPEGKLKTSCHYELDDQLECFDSENI